MRNSNKTLIAMQVMLKIVTFNQNTSPELLESIITTQKQITELIQKQNIFFSELTVNKK
jgi:hypothetical protein